MFSYVSVILWLNIAFYFEKCVCTHFDHVIMIQAKKSETIDIQAICLYVILKKDFFLSLSALVEVNLAKSLTDHFEKLVFCKICRKRPCRSLFFSKVADTRSATLLKKRLRHRCFSVNFTKFLRTPFLQNTSGQLLFFLIYFVLVILLLT